VLHAAVPGLWGGWVAGAADITHADFLRRARQGLRDNPSIARGYPSRVQRKAQALAHKLLIPTVLL